MNIEQLGLGDSSFDVAVCNHVLEHVNDLPALSELHRVLRPNGLLFVMVPTIEGCQETYEDATVLAPHDREVHFGQSDHLRVYGSDVKARLSQAGFDVQVHSACGSESVAHGLVMGEKVFVCRKSPNHGPDTTAERLAKA